MKNYKVFTESEFNQRVEMFWNLMIKPEFNIPCVPIQHDRAKRRTRNLGISHYKSGKPAKLSFSYRMLDGRWTLDSIDDVIKHEIGHSLALLRFGKSQKHNKNFHAIGREFGFDAYGTQEMEQSEIFEEVQKADFERRYGKQTQKSACDSGYKYIVKCGYCGHEYKYKRIGKVMKKIEEYGIESGYRCHKCGSCDLYNTEPI